jgi:hypothetical protein
VVGDDGRSQDRWRARPGAAAGARAVALVVPLLAGTVVGRWAVGALGDAGAGPVASTALGVAGGVAVALLGRRSARPLLALATLLELGLTFPGAAPNRRLAARDSRPRAAVQRVRTSRTGTAGDAAHAVVVLIAALSAYDRRGRYRTRRVRAVAGLIGERLGLDGPQRDRLEWAALLHDIGTLTVEPQILDKAGRPTPAQWDILRRHPADGARLAGPLLGWLGEWGAAIRHHHERWDGAGYPDGLAGEQIPRSARIVALADAYASMTAARPYRAPMATRTVYAEVARGRGSQFDPSVVDAFLTIPLRRLLRASGPVAVLANLPALATLARVGQPGVVATAAPQAAMVAASTAVVLGGVAASGGLVPAPGSAGGSVTAAGPAPAASTTPRPSATADAAASTPASTPRRGTSHRRTGRTPEPSTRPTPRPTTPRPTTPRPTTSRPTAGPTGGPTTTSPTTSPTTAGRTTGPTTGPTTTPVPSPEPDPAATTARDRDTGRRAAPAGPAAPTLAVRPPAETALHAVGVGWLARAGVSYECRLDDAGWAACDGTGFATYLDLEPGPHRFAVRAVDPATGARGEPARTSWVVV